MSKPTVDPQAITCGVLKFFRGLVAKADLTTVIKILDWLEDMDTKILASTNIPAWLKPWIQAHLTALETFEALMQTYPVKEVLLGVLDWEISIVCPVTPT